MAAINYTAGMIMNSLRSNFSNPKKAILNLSDLPMDILKVILMHYCRNYFILTQHVCQSWRTVITCIGIVEQTKQPHNVNVLSLTEFFAENGHIHVLQWIYNCIMRSLHVQINWNAAMTAAARAGHIDIVRLCHNYNGGLNRYYKDGVDMVNWVMIDAAGAGHTDIVRLCYEEYGARMIYWAMTVAASQGHIDIIRLCRGVYCGNGINEVMATAAYHGHIDVVRLCKETYGATNFTMTMEKAAAAGHIDIVRLCIEEYGARYIDSAMASAVERGHTAIVQLLHQFQE